MTSGSAGALYDGRKIPGIVQSASESKKPARDMAKIVFVGGGRVLVVGDVRVK